MTRWLVVLLLAANLGLMAWIYHRLSQEPRPPAVTEAEEVTTLRLVSELETDAVVAAAPADEDADLPTDAHPLPAPPPAEPVAVAEAAQPAEPPLVAQAAEEPAEPSETPQTPDETPDAVAPAPPTPAPPTPAPPTPDPTPAPTPAPVTPAPDVPPAAATAETCLTLGPLPEAPAAERLLAWIEAHGGTARSRTEIVGRKDTHWMYLGPFRDLGSARRESERLTALGVTDHLAVRHEELGPVVSLGLYSSTEGRERRIAALRTLGVEPHVVPRGPRSTRFWVDARFPATHTPAPEAFTGAGAGEIGSVETTDCP